MLLKDIFYYLIISRSGYFDKKYYLHFNQDVRIADVDPLWHFIRMGWKEGRNPSEQFNTNYYLRSNLDVKQLKINPLIHYIKFGKAEGRQTTPQGKSVNGSYNSIDELRVFDEVFASSGAAFTSIRPLRIFQEPPKDSGNCINSEGSTKMINKFAHTLINFLPIYTNKISVIIPTKNAGDDFNQSIKMFTNQDGIEEVEIIIVDSGSTDNTLEIAKAHGAKVIQILPEEFSHSYARNLGAESATGDYLLFSVQDALPPTKTWLYELFTVINENDVSVVSCAEMPRINSDLFYRVISWNHYNFLGVNKQDKIFQMPKDSNYQTLRQNGQISDIACLIPKKLFSEYKYRFNYAEDLDLGIRLIKDGHKIAFLSSTRIIHSHNRPPFYFLKRGYVDNLFLSDIFSDFPVPQGILSTTVDDIIFSYEFVNTQIIEYLSSLKRPTHIDSIEKRIRKIVEVVDKLKYPSIDGINRFSKIDKELQEFLVNLADISRHEIHGDTYQGTIMKNLIGFFNITFSYLHSCYDLADLELINEIGLCFLKEISLISGAHLAYCYITDTSTEKETIKVIHEILREGI